MRTAAACARSLPVNEPFDDPGSYFEALNANLTRNWAPLTGLVHGRHKLIDLPLPEIYDLAADPGEERNLYASQRDRARDMEARLDRIAGSASPSAPAALDADAQARLRSLGYVVASVAPKRTYTAADDPKRLVHLNAALDDAVAIWSRGDGARAIETLQAVVRERPDLTLAYDRLAFMLRASGRVGDAVAVLDEAARAGHADRSAAAIARLDAARCGRSPAIGLGARTAGARRCVRPAGDRRARPDLREDGARPAGPGDVRTGAQRRRRTPRRRGTILARCRSRRTARRRRSTPSRGGRDQPRSRHRPQRPRRGLRAAGADRSRRSTQWRKALELRPDFADARHNLEQARR